MKKEYINIPNILSFYRLVSFPFLLWLIFKGNESLFAILFCVNLVTDILDGLIARLFKLQTEFGARLDSLADYGSYILAFLGIYKFKVDEIGENIWLLFVFTALILIYNLIALLKFRKFPSLHMYSTKVGGYIQGIFFFTLFTLGYFKWVYFTAMIWGFCSSLEEILVLFLLSEMRSNVKGLFWVLKEKANTQRK